MGRGNKIMEKRRKKIGIDDWNKLVSRRLRINTVRLTSSNLLWESLYSSLVFPKGDAGPEKKNAPARGV